MVDGTGSESSIVATRQALHAVAERLLAGPQYRTSGTIRLAVTGDGFTTTRSPGAGISALSVRGNTVVREPDGLVVPLTGTIEELAAALGVEPGAPSDVYTPTSTLPADQPLALSPTAVQLPLRALVAGHQALHALIAAGSDPDLETVLWPEHFDLGISLDEINFGISPGDDEHPRPYAYVGPWKPRRGAFWSEPFGASFPLDDPDDLAAITAFLREGQARAAADPLADPPADAQA
jgi:hypothetical protein